MTIAVKDHRAAVYSLALLFITAAGPASFADPVTSPPGCDQTSDPAMSSQVVFSPAEGFKVTGAGRLYFYSEPDETCLVRQIFVIPNDELVAYSSFKGWYSVMYTNPKTGKDYEGWVHAERLHFVGTD